VIETIVKNGKTYARVEDLRIAKTNVRQTSLNIEETIDCKDQDLADSIEAVGQKQAVVCDPHGNVYIGGRRLRAAKIDKKDLIEVKVEDIPEDEQLLASYQENDTQKNLTPFERAKFYLKYMKKKGLGERELAEELHHSYSRINDHIRVYETFGTDHSTVNILYDEQIEEGDNQALTFGKAVVLVPLEKETRDKLVKEIQTDGITQSQLTRIIKASQALEELVENLDSEEDIKAAKKVLEGKLYTNKMKPMDLFYDINNAMGNPQKLRPYPRERIQTKASDFANQEAADAWFEERGGRCYGKEEVYYGEVDPMRLKRKAQKK
jgi:ParB/RepB/Spo0J family partition protein